MSLPPLVSHSQLPHPQETLPTPALPRPTGRSGPDSCVVTALCWVPVHVKSCVHPLRVESLFPLFLWSSCTQALLAFNAKCSGTPPPVARLSLESPTWGSELTPMGEPLSYDYFAVCGLPIQWVQDLIMSRKCLSYHLVVTSLDVKIFFFGRFQSFFVYGCSAVSCDFGVFVRRGPTQVLLCHLVQNRGLYICSFPDTFPLKVITRC